MAACCSAILACGQTGARPNFSGTWKLNLQANKLEITPPDSSVFYLDHREPLFLLKRTHVFRGTPNTWGIELATDGKEVIQKQADGPDFHVRLRWQGRALIFDSYRAGSDGKTTNVVRYTLSEDGKVFTADERLAGPKIKHHNVWVFDRR